jgi:hypothetical protein
MRPSRESKSRAEASIMPSIGRVKPSLPAPAEVFMLTLPTIVLRV